MDQTASVVGMAMRRRDRSGDRIDERMDDIEMEYN